jgi:phosphoserine aminotransferase
VLFVQGGASTQFAALPLNFAAEGETVDFVVTGSWGQKYAAGRRFFTGQCLTRPAACRAAEEAAKYNTVNIAATGKPGKFTGTAHGKQKPLVSQARCTQTSRSRAAGS